MERTRNYRLAVASFSFCHLLCYIMKCVNKEVNDVVYKEREETVSSSVNKRLNCK